MAVIANAELPLPRVDGVGEDLGGGRPSPVEEPQDPDLVRSPAAREVEREDGLRVDVREALAIERAEPLARRFVDLAETPRSDEEIIALLKSRVQRFDVTRPEVLAAVPA